jgi:signal peptidase II
MKPDFIGALRAMKPRWRLFLAVVAIIVVADQITKFVAVGSLTRAFEAPVGQEELGFGDRLSRFLWSEHPVRTEPVAVLDDFWHFRYAENPGAAFSFLASQPTWFRTPFFLLVSLGAMVFIAIYYRRTAPGQNWLRLALAMVFGGALGNFIDRIRLGYVIDFIDWHWYDKATWPTFNIADSAITVGIALMVIEMFLNKGPSEAGRKPAKA